MRATRQLPAVKNDARRVWIFSAISWQARVLGVAEGALAGEALQLAGDIVGHTRENVLPVITDLSDTISTRLYCASMP